MPDAPRFLKYKNLCWKVLKLCPVAALLGAALKIKIGMEYCWDDKWHGKTTVFGQKPVLVPLYSP